MCSYKQTSEDEPCSITYPTEVHVQKTKLKDRIILTCNTSCPMADPHTAYRWYWNRVLNRHCENQDITLFQSHSEIYSCAVKGHEDLHSGEDCAEDDNCLSVNYVSRRICALQGSSVNISSEYSYRNNQPQPSWYIKKRSNEDAEELKNVEYYDMKISHILGINNVKKNDSAEYSFRLQQYYKQWEQSDLPGVTLVVTGLEVKFTPSAVVTEGQRVTLTCSTSCPLTDDTKFIWYLNGRPLTLPENQNKHLVLDPVSSQHAGNYSCAVKTHNNISSPIETLTVNVVKEIGILNAVKLVFLSTTPLAVFLLYLIMRRIKSSKKKTAAEPSDKAQTGQMDPLYDSLAPVDMNPAAQTEAAAVQQEDTV
ncbi:contactin-5-like [Morone saxatilis]|uniref:contactin-5-like n=1 Tax=Morone saxatilis TaxID=34816 RepID=UPI0015E2007F|nr:contactin-5-like [Morone saxatilis]